MKIMVVGINEKAKEYIKKHINEDILCYDNDRRKWGNKVLNKFEILTLKQFLDIVKECDCDVVTAVNNITILCFLKDAGVSKCRLYHADSENWELISLNNIEPYRVDVNAIENDKLKKYEEAKKYFLENNNKVAYDHAVKFLNYKKKNIMTLDVEGIELTNNCNLACPNCPTPKCKRKKGYMSDEVFEEAFKYIEPNTDTFFSLHGLGEPLLHPKFFQYLQRVVEIGRPVVVSTNGLLLDEDTSKKLLNILDKAPKSLVYVSFHSSRSVEGWRRCIKWLYEYGKDTNVKIYGQILEHNEEQARRWLKDIGIDKPEENQCIRFISSHSFAGNVQERRKKYEKIEVNNRFRNCYYHCRNVTLVAWDGRLKSCCMDSELQANIGNIFDLKNAKGSDTPYLLCNNCDPDWTSNWQ